jgi:uncharacterized membrane protein YtjA (UPF0391 family)
MLKWAPIFAVTALVAGVFGFTDTAASLAGGAQILFIPALVLFVVAVQLALLGIGADSQPDPENLFTPHSRSSS